MPEAVLGGLVDKFRRDARRLLALAFADEAPLGVAPRLVSFLVAFREDKAVAARGVAVSRGAGNICRRGQKGRSGGGVTGAAVTAGAIAAIGRYLPFKGALALPEEEVFGDAGLEVPPGQGRARLPGADAGLG